MTGAAPQRTTRAAGLAVWLEAVVTQHARARVALRTDVVHDLRVALRRCRSLAQSLREIDDEDGAARFKALAQAARPLFSGLGALRDAQVMRAHARRLLPHEPGLAAVERSLRTRVSQARAGARAAVTAFSVQLWREAGAGLPARARALLAERPVLDHLLLRRFHDAHLLHRAALRARRPEDFHALRIGVKKLRYAAENLAPELHATMGKVLKRMQDALGDLHDFDVLLGVLSDPALALAEAERTRALEVVTAARDTQLQAYLALAARDARSSDSAASGAWQQGAWQHIERALPAGPARLRAHTAGIRQRALHAGAPRAPVRALESAAAVLARGLGPRLPDLDAPRARALLAWASACACIADGGKKAARFAQRLPLAAGFGPRDRALLTALTRAARRPLQPEDPRLEPLLARDRPLAVALGAVLHLAAALAGAAPLALHQREGVVLVLLGAPLQEHEAVARFAEARAPLEALLGAPVWWHAL